jgi:predicted dithiol-disulfide oxidoreductase (DUF899 family)
LICLKAELKLCRTRTIDKHSRRELHARLADDIDTRGIDAYNPIWNVMDLTPRGRGTRDASLDYGTKVPAPRLQTVS